MSRFDVSLEALKNEAKLILEEVEQMEAVLKLRVKRLEEIKLEAKITEKALEDYNGQVEQLNRN